jgi:ribosome maturation factor RimP
LKLEEQLKNIAHNFLKDDTYFIVDVISKAATGRQKILVLLDSDEGVTIDDCAQLSRSMGHYLEEEEVLEHAYVLEVSSPGLDHPLTLPRQFKKNVNRHFKLLLTDGSTIKGRLKEMKGEELLLEMEANKKKKEKEPSEIRVTLSEIEKANVLVSFK